MTFIERKKNHEKTDTAFRYAILDANGLDDIMIKPVCISKVATWRWLFSISP